MRLHDLPVHQKPREKLIEQGPQNLKDEELLAIILRTGYKGTSVLEVAKNIVQTHSLPKLFTKTHEQLSRIKGIGKAKAAEIVAIQELFFRYTTLPSKPTIRSSDDVYKLVYSITKKKQEHLLALLLNARNQLISIETISIGTLTANLAHPREVFAAAIKKRAAGIILVHNHPSGDCTPSKEDVETTQRLLLAGEIVGIEILDHLVVSIDSFVSIITNKKGL